MNALKPWHIVVLLVVILLLFGARRLPDLARSVGESLRIFKREVKDLADDEPRTTPTPPPTAQPAPPLATGPVVNPTPSAAPAPPLDTPGTSQQPPATGSTTPTA